MTHSPSRAFREGFFHAVPFLLSVIPFGMVVGTLAVNGGASAGEALLQSIIFFAGASQMVMWELHFAGNSFWVVVAAIFAVNFRMILYSAAAGRKLEPLSRPRMMGALFLMQDVSMALGMKRAEQPGGLTLAYYLGVSVLLYVTWVGATAIGVVFGSLIERPQMYGLDILVPVYFLTLALGFRSKPNAAVIFATSAGTAAIVYLWVGSPYHIATGGLAGMAVAAVLAKPSPGEADVCDV